MIYQKKKEKNSFKTSNFKPYCEVTVPRGVFIFAKLADITSTSQEEIIYTFV